MILRMMHFLSDYYIDLMENKSDPRSRHIFMVESPIPTLALVGCYILFVKVIGPKFMANRKAFDLTKCMIVYNAFHAIISATLFYQGTTTIFYSWSRLVCVPANTLTDSLTMKALNVSWWFFMSRFIEFVDTIFFILRKKFNQVTTLHLVHHSLVPIISWIGMKFVPIGHYTFAGYINTFVHVFMYSYYMLAAMGPSVKKYLWWKKYLTTLQLLFLPYGVFIPHRSVILNKGFTLSKFAIGYDFNIRNILQSVQFVLVMAHTINTILSDCPVPKEFAIVIGLQAQLFFMLFYKFYNTEYIRSTPSTRKIVENLANMCIPDQTKLFNGTNSITNTEKSNENVRQRAKS